MISESMAFEGFNPLEFSVCGCPPTDLNCIAQGCPDFLGPAFLSNPAAFGIDPSTIGSAYSCEYAERFRLPKAGCPAPGSTVAAAPAPAPAPPAPTGASTAGGRDMSQFDFLNGPAVPSSNNGGFFGDLFGRVLDVGTQLILANNAPRPASPGLGFNPWTAAPTAIPANAPGPMQQMGEGIDTIVDAVRGEGVQPPVAGISCPPRNRVPIITPMGSPALFRTDLCGRKRVVRRAIVVDEAGNARVMVDAGKIKGELETKRVRRRRRGGR